MKKLMLMFTFVCIVAYSCKKEDSGNAPNCEILIPLNNTQIIAGQIIDISVGAVDQNGTITDVRIFIAGEERASFSSEPYTYSWNTKTETIGEKQIQARCTDNDGNQTQATIMVTIITGTLPPVANFSADVTTGLNPLEVKFSDGTEFNPSTWQWNFGDGNSSTEQNPVHIYADYGVYSVTLTVTNSAGSDALTKYDYIHVVNNNIPIADFSVNAREAYNPFWAYFVDQSQNEPTSWEWEFGDGQGSTDQHPLHIYENPGFYSIKLTASNSYGSDEMFFQDYITILSAGSPNGTMTDPRDGKIYNTTQIGEQVWFAENLSYDIADFIRGQVLLLHVLKGGIFLVKVSGMPWWIF